MDIDTFDRLSEISYRLECGTELLYALFCVLRHDDYTAKDFAPVMEALNKSPRTSWRHLFRLNCAKNP